MMITKSLRLYAIQEPFAEWVLGLVTRNPVDITQYSCEDFLRYYDNEFDLDNPTQYDQVLAQTAEKHNKEMKKLAADTANTMTTTGEQELPQTQVVAVQVEVHLVAVQLSRMILIKRIWRPSRKQVSPTSSNTLL